MGKGKYVFSTLTATNEYPIYEYIEGRGLPNAVSSVLIYGGANLPSHIFDTPKGVVTPITDEEFDQLNKSPGFQFHVDGGHLTVEDRPYEIESVVKDMESKDASAPIVPKDYEDAGLDAPTTGPVTDEDPEAGLMSTKKSKPQVKHVGAKPKGRKPRAGSPAIPAG